MLVYVWIIFQMFLYCTSVHWESVSFVLGSYFFSFFQIVFLRLLYIHVYTVHSFGNN